jgi:hypothetical protein
MLMRATLLVLLLGVVGCGEDAVDTPDQDAPEGNRPDPRVIPGGGIGDGAIDGVVNLYVIDEVTREPISGAEVRVGELAGSTDADGLFVAEGVVGPQDIVVKAAGHRKEFWVGANGANVTINLEADLLDTPPSVTLTGTITNYASLQATNTKIAVVSYSTTDRLGDPANEIATPPIAPNPLPPNLCIGASCDFTINTRTGKLALFASIFDFDNKGTETEDDDTAVLIGFAVRTGIDTGALSGSQDLTLIPLATGAQSVTVDFDTPPAGLDERGAAIGIEIGDEGVITVATNDGTGTVQVPKLSAISGATGYRLTAFATDGETVPAQSIALRRGITGTTLAAESWLAPPTGITLTRSSASWTNSADATVHSVELSQGDTRILNITVFDASRTEIDLPDLIVLPSGPIDAAVNALGAPGFDVTNFSLDEDFEKIDRVAGQETSI